MLRRLTNCHIIIMLLTLRAQALCVNVIFTIIILTVGMLDCLVSADMLQCYSGHSVSIACK